MKRSTLKLRFSARLSAALAAAALLALGACTSSLDPPAPLPAAAPQQQPPVATAPPPVPQAAPPVRRPPRVKLRRPGYDAVGLASWYGRRYHGRRTASGEVFDMNAPTAAHPTLPFGTRVHVTNLANGRAVILRINDRGPFVRRRIIDVSRSAARALGFLRQGVAQVRVRLYQPEQAYR